MKVRKTDADAVKLKAAVRRHLKRLGFIRDADGKLVPPKLDKDAYREMHGAQRTERLTQERAFAKRAWLDVGQHFANGSDVDIDSITVRLEQVCANTWQADLFRLACLLWSVPVSKGYGRRMRFLVWDDSNSKLIGLFALGDPVFNLKARDTAIGWSGEDRKDRLVGILDAYVLGAVPPYSNLLGGKLVASTIRSKEVVEIFRRRYRNTAGTISGQKKQAQLVAVTTTSALGRSSVYNRLTLGGIKYFRSIGYTTGYGHFHFPERLFERIRGFLERRNDSYADGHGYGDGANWRFRAIRRALPMLGLSPALLKHGLKREVFLCSLADNAASVLCGHSKRPTFATLLSVEEIGRLAVARWIKPRSERDLTFLAVTREDTLARIVGRSSRSLIPEPSRAYSD